MNTLLTQSGVDLEWLKEEANIFIDLFERDARLLDHCVRHPEEISNLSTRVNKLFAASPFALWKKRLIEEREKSGDFSELFALLEKLIDVTSDIHEKARGLAWEVFSEAQNPRPNPIFSAVDSRFFGTIDREGVSSIVTDLLKTIRSSSEYLETMTGSIARLRKFQEEK